MFKLISHIALLVLILLSATGLTINMHFCQDQLYDFALSASAHDCCGSGGHEKHHPMDSEMDNTDLCDDGTIMIESTDEFFMPAYSFNFDDIRQIELFYPTHILTNQSTTNSALSKLLVSKKPPTPQKVVLSQIQSFLI